ncbi:hypothetical protein KBI31_01725 [Patescibacteria group bacterium]|nr:hypothetical protein [Patescibacteria group bacterium]
MTKSRYFFGIILFGCALLVAAPSALAVTTCAETVPGTNTAKCLKTCTDDIIYMVPYPGGDLGCKNSSESAGDKCCGTCTTHDLKSEGAARCLDICTDPYPSHDGEGDQHCPSGKKCCYMPQSVTPATPPDQSQTNQTESKPLDESALPKFNSLLTADVNIVIGNIIKSLLGLTGTLTLVMMVVAGIMWMTAGGKEQTITKAKKMITWTAIGLAIIFSSYIILKSVFDVLTTNP